MRKKTGLVLCHGWGFDSSFFQGLIVNTSQFDVINWDLGYFNKPALEMNLDYNLYWIGVGHSFGFVKLLLSGIKFNALVSVQGFTDFITDIPIFKEKRFSDWHKMYNDFNHNPKKELHRFYKLCGLSETSMPSSKLFENINYQTLSSDLKQLIELFHLPLVPTLVIAGNLDPVIPLQVVNHNFSDNNNVSIVIESCNHHLLGYKQCIFKHLMNFISANQKALV